MGQRVGKALVIAEVSLSLILLAGAGLLIESTVRMSSAPLGFRTDHLLSARISLPATAYPRLSNRATFYNRLASTLAAIPGVDGVALTSSLPLYVAGSGVMSVQGRAAPPLSDIGDVRGEDVSNDYFRVMGIPLVQGRVFDARDREESQPVTIVNEAIVREYFPNQDPIGQQIKFGRPEDTDPWMTIIGVVGNVRRTTVYQEMGYVTPPVLYQPLTQDAENLFGIVVRTSGNPLALAPLLQREVFNLDNGVPVFDVLTMDQRVTEFLSHPQFRAILLGMFAGLALALAAVGIFGVLSQLVSQRTREFGIRMALGAHQSDVLAMVVKQGAVLVLLGVGLGLAVALALSRLLSTMLYGVRPTDPFTFTAVTSLLILVAMLACYLPARRATKVDPMIALRHE
jgi:putative ABC transport system permease protein